MPLSNERTAAGAEPLPDVFRSRSRFCASSMFATTCRRAVRDVSRQTTNVLRKTARVFPEGRGDPGGSSSPPQARRKRAPAFRPDAEPPRARSGLWSRGSLTNQLAVGECGMRPPGAAQCGTADALHARATSRSEGTERSACTHEPSGHLHATTASSRRRMAESFDIIVARVIVVYRPEAVSDLRRIARWYRKHRPDGESRFFEQFCAAMAQLQQFPKSSPPTSVDSTIVHKARVLGRRIPSPSC